MFMKRTVLEKIAVTAMFVLVLIVFSFANRDTQKLIQQQSKTAVKTESKPLLTAAVISSSNKP